MDRAIDGTSSGFFFFFYPPGDQASPIWNMIMDPRRKKHTNKLTNKQTNKQNRTASRTVNKVQNMQNTQIKYRNKYRNNRKTAVPEQVQNKRVQQAHRATAGTSPDRAAWNILKDLFLRRRFLTKDRIIFQARRVEVWVLSTSSRAAVIRSASCWCWCWCWG